MECITKLRLLSSEAAVESVEDGCVKASKGYLEGIVVSHASLPNGKRIRILKSLLTSACENDCNYCGLRAGRDTERASFSPEEFAKLIVNLTQAGLIQGAFISSGVAGGGMRTQDKLIACARVLRQKLKYCGYIHLKIMPGAEYEQVLASLMLADRVSINLEAPNAARLAELAPGKHFKQHLWQTLVWARKIRNMPTPAFTTRLSWPSVSTQFVVGASDESDRELLSVTQTLFTDLDLRRIYYSAFKPIRNTPLENHQSIPFQREQRLYQASYLLRDYGFQWEEISLDQDGNLPLSCDPKTLWARSHLSEKPLEINHASPQELLRVPGIGLLGVKALLSARKDHALNDISMLTKLGIHAERASPFILLCGRQPVRQLRLFV